jgi:hypothetical protein
MRPFKFIASLAIATLLGLFTSFPTVACPYTPLAWQKRVEQHSMAVFVGQRKHLTWIRDQNRNFIDDRLEATARSAAALDVIVDLNRCLTPPEIERALAPYGRVEYVGRLITVVLLSHVAPADLPKLAARPEVAMIQERALMNPEMDIVSRSVEAHKSSQYSGTAEDLGLTGNGVVIAIMGTGVSDSAFTALTNKRVAGFDATDPSDPADGTTNPPDTGTHESVMAAIAVGAGVAGETCRNPGAGATPNCAGIASGARYVNVRQCHIVNGSSTCDSYIQAADWVGLSAAKFGIRIVNMAFSSCGDDDGTSAEAEQANYLVAIGLVVVAASSKNPANCTSPGLPGDTIVRAPGSGSYVLMVNASADKGTVDRSDDVIWSNFTRGPRQDFTLASPDWSALKPDLTAPGQQLPILNNPSMSLGLEVYRSPTLSHLAGVAGNSPATAIVAGLAALILEKYPLMTAESVKQLLIDSADQAVNTPYSTSTGKWDSALGWGLARVGKALQMAAGQATDLTFPNCAATGSTVGQPCVLSNGQPNWNNAADIATATAPRVNVANTISVNVTNRGNTDALATVNFGVMVFSAGNVVFHHVGSQQVMVPAHQTVPASAAWTPTSTDHTCAQISIAFGQDSDYSNNMTQRNLVIAASTYQMEVNNPLFVPAHFDVVAKPERAGWICSVDQPAFDLDPFVDCPRKVAITLRAPRNAKPGQQARCQVAVFAKPEKGERRPIGGVTVVSYVPRPCNVQGQLVDVVGRPLSRAQIDLAALEPEHAKTSAHTTTDAQGFFEVTTLPDVLQRLSVRAEGGWTGQLALRPMCGPSLPRVVVGKGSLRLDYLPPVVMDNNAHLPGEAPR